MPAESPACPFCHSVEGVYPVSRIYIAGITHPAHRTAADWIILRAACGKVGTEMDSLGQILQRVEPPRSEPDGPNLLHPDIGAGIAAIFLVVLIGNVYAASRQVWTPALWAGAGMGFIYLLARSRLMGGYHAARAARITNWRLFSGNLARWRRSYFCPREQQVFNPEPGFQPKADPGLPRPSEQGQPALRLE